MKYIILFILFSLSLEAWTQKPQFKLRNALVIGQLEKTEDRYSVEINVTEVFDQCGINAKPSLNFLKYGENPQDLSKDSLTNLLKSKGIDTYVIVSIRGYDRNYKRSNHQEGLETELGEGNIFPIYREEATSVTFEFTFYRNGFILGSDLIKCGNVSDRDGVMKKLRKHLSKRILKKWRKG